MKRSIATLGIAALTALGVAMIGVAPAGAASKDPRAQFKSLKPVKEPKTCKDEPGVTDTEIKVAAIAPQSGPAASLGAFIDGFKARIEKANATKELGSRQITLVTYDEKNDPAQALSVAQSAVEKDGVFAIGMVSNQSDAMGKYLSEQGVPVVGWPIGIAAWGTYPNFFGYRHSAAPNAGTYNSLNADVLKKLGAKKVAVIGTNAAASITAVNQTVDAVERTKGLEVVYQTAEVPLDATDFTAWAQEIKSSGADSLYAAMGTVLASNLSQALRQAQVNLKAFLVGGGYDPRVLGLAGMDQAYVYIDFKPFELNPPGLADYKQYLTKVKPDAIFNQITANGWLSGEMLVEGIKAAGVNCPTRKAFIANLRLQDDYAPNGWFDPTDLVDVFGQPLICVYTLQAQTATKTFVPQFGGQEVCAKKRYVNNKLAKTTVTTAAGSATTTTAAR